MFLGKTHPPRLPRRFGSTPPGARQPPSPPDGPRPIPGNPAEAVPACGPEFDKGGWSFETCGREALLYRALLLIGVAGVGKSTVVMPIRGILAAAGFATAVVDTDALAQFGPPPSHGQLGISFHDQLKCMNLSAGVG